MSKLTELADLGQAIWLDYIRRSFLAAGELQTLINQGLRGVTSNPSIFEKAIVGSDDYDEDFLPLVNADKSIEEIYEALALKDIATAADQLRPVFNKTAGKDGFVSIEVSPELANDTHKTISEAMRLYTTLNRPNVMIKVPATDAGIPAVKELIGSGVNVNVTLIFGLENYKAVAEAYIDGLEQLSQSGPQVSNGHDIDKVASVASFFVSRVDTAVDAELEKINNESLRGKIAVANAKVAYAEFEKIFSGARWEGLVNMGARVQRPLWASTGTKNPNYSDILYVETLIGSHTVNTLPPDTLDNFVDHGEVKITINQEVDKARDQMLELNKLGINLESITAKLQEDGVAAFAKSFTSLMNSIAEKKKLITTEKKTLLQT